MANYITSLYTSDGSNGIYLHDGVGTYGSLEARDNSYRYNGADPNNYVCFGSNTSPCPEDNLYRIVGVFDGQVKLIKVTSIGNYNWSSENFNTWDATTKPHIYITLNNGYYNSLETTWQNLIADATWQVGGVSYEDVNNNPVKITYNYEVGIN